MFITLAASLTFLELAPAGAGWPATREEIDGMNAPAEERSSRKGRFPTIR